MSPIQSVQKTLDLIEEHLSQPLSMEEIARNAGMSLWHYQRTFSAMVGESVGAYVRRRRLHEAARHLRAGQRTILEIALDCQFESHSAFTRAFKAETSLSPSQFRERLDLEAGMKRVYLTFESLGQRFQHMNLTPEIVTLPSRSFIGLQTRFNMGCSPNPNNLKVIPALWQTFDQRCREIPTQAPEAAYGLSKAIDENVGRTDEALYLAGLEVPPDAAPPKGMDRWESTGGLFAKFIMKGPVQQISATIAFIYGKWLPESDYTRRPGPDIERMDERFNPTSEASLLEIFIPIEKS